MKIFSVLVFYVCTALLLLPGSALAQNTQAGVVSDVSTDLIERRIEQTPWRDGTTHILFEPLDFIARLAALIPRPGVIIWTSDDEAP